MQCYAIIGKDDDGKDVQCFKEQDGPFCCDEHNKLWSDANYGLQGKDHSVAQIQKRLRDMAQDVKLKRSVRETLFD